MGVGISWRFGPRADVTKSRNASSVRGMSGPIGFASFLDLYCSAEKRQKNNCGVLVHQDVGRSALHIPNPANVRMNPLDTRDDIQAPVHNPPTVGERRHPTIAALSPLMGQFARIEHNHSAKQS